MRSNRIGFMQGRLSPMIDGQIQCFPWPYWQAEFALGAALGLTAMEWTIDQDRMAENPLMTETGRQEIAELRRANDFVIPSLTGDCFMQAPFWKVGGADRRDRKDTFLNVVDSCNAAGISIVVVPLVDGGRLANMEEEDILVDFLLANAGHFADRHVRITFESDFEPDALARFIGRLPGPAFGVNYDIGNSAALGMNPREEISAYGPRILNVPVTDRQVGGTTVPLGEGNADFEAVFEALSGLDYDGNFILQTARAADGDHARALATYRDMVRHWLDAA